MLNEVAFFFFSRAFARGHADHAFAAAPLRAERADRGALDKSAVRNADDATFVRDEIFHVDLAFVGNEFGQARRTMFVFQFTQLFLDDRENALLFRENVTQILNRFDQLFVFVLDLVPLEAGQLIQAKIENLVGLMFAERVTAFGQTGGVANQDSNLLDLSFREI